MDCEQANHKRGSSQQNGLWVNFTGIGNYLADILALVGSFTPILGSNFAYSEAEMSS